MGRPRKYDGATVTRVVTLYAKGVTYDEITRQTGIPRGSLKSIIEREGIDRTRATRMGNRRIDKIMGRAIASSFDDLTVENQRLRDYVKVQREEVAQLRADIDRLRRALAEAEWRLAHPNYKDAF